MKPCRNEEREEKCCNRYQHSIILISSSDITFSCRDEEREEKQSKRRSFHPQDFLSRVSSHSDLCIYVFLYLCICAILICVYLHFQSATQYLSQHPSLEIKNVFQSAKEWQQMKGGSGKKLNQNLFFCGTFFSRLFFLLKSRIFSESYEQKSSNYLQWWSRQWLLLLENNGSGESNWCCNNAEWGGSNQCWRAWRSRLILDFALDWPVVEKAQHFPFFATALPVSVHDLWLFLCICFASHKL